MFKMAAKKEIHMKRIEAIIGPAKVSEVCAALEKAGHSGLMISEVAERGNQKGWVNQIRGMSYNVSMLTKARVEVDVQDDDVSRIINAICDAALTDEVGDGNIFVHDIANAVKIRPMKPAVASLKRC
jgi:nitrogen regulatory protein P-II 1